MSLCQTTTSSDEDKKAFCKRTALKVWAEPIKTVIQEKAKLYTSVLFENAGLSLHKLHLNQNLIENISYLGN